MDEKHYVYKVINKLDANAIYIGYTVNLKKRWKAHKDWTFSPSKKKYHLNKAILKFGIENFVMEEIECWPTARQALDREIFFIAHYRTNNYNVYNETDGGEGVHGAKISAAKMGHTVSQETRNKISKSLTGVKLDPIRAEKLAEARIKRSEKIRPKHEQICQLLSEGLSRTKIAKMFDISIANVSQIAKKYGFKMMEFSPPLDQISIGLIKTDIINAISYNKIAKKYNVSLSTIVRIRNKFELKSPKHKLNKEMVLEIVQLLNENVSIADIAKKFNIAKKTVSGIKNGVNWSAVTGIKKYATPPRKRKVCDTKIASNYD